MDIERIDTYADARFSQKVLKQHGCFLVDEEPYEVEIVSDHEAILRGRNTDAFDPLMDAFRFYTPHITTFYDASGRIWKEYPQREVLTLSVDMIQPSQFYVDEEKVKAVSSFIQAPEDIIIQVLPYGERYISLDGHTRLYYAVRKGFESVRAVVETSEDWVYSFVAEAQKRNVYTPKDLQKLEHSQYEEKWNRFCDRLLGREE